MKPPVFWLVLASLVLLVSGCSSSGSGPVSAGASGPSAEVLAQIEEGLQSQKASLVESNGISVENRQKYLAFENKSTVLREGAFSKVLFEVPGKAMVVQRPPDYFLALSGDVSVRRGPGLSVGLIKARSVKTMHEARENGLQEVYSLIDTTGYQEYDLSGLDHTDYKALILYSKPLDLVWAVAPLDRARAN